MMLSQRPWSGARFRAGRRPLLRFISLASCSPWAAVPSAQAPVLMTWQRAARNSLFFGGELSLMARVSLAWPLPAPAATNRASSSVAGHGWRGRTCLGVAGIVQVNGVMLSPLFGGGGLVVIIVMFDGNCGRLFAI